MLVVTSTSKIEDPRRVLFLDDDPVQLKLGYLQLRDAGFEVETALSAERALDEARAGHIDAILCDVIMEELDGFAFCVRLRDEPGLAHIPVVLTSAHYTGEAAEQLATRVGASALVARTPEFTAEIEALRSLGGTPPSVDSSKSCVYEDHLRTNAHQLAKLAGQARRAQNRYRALFENASDAISILTADGVVLEANQRWEEILKIPPEQMVGRHIRDLAAPGHERANEDLFAKSVEAGALRVEAVPLRRPDGGTVYMTFSTTVIEQDGQPLVLSIGHDVTECVLGEQALKSAELRYRSLVERMPDLVWAADETGRMTYVSPNVLQIFGFTADEMRAEDAATRMSRIHPEEAQIVQDAFKALFAEGKPFDVEYRRQRKDGTWIWVRNRATAMLEREGVRYVEGLLSDVTDRRRLEEQLRHAQKMEAVGRLAGGVAHDFNNMLNILLGYTEMLLDEVADGHPMYVALCEMKRAAERSAELTQQLLAFSRQRPTEVQRVDVNETVASVEKLARRVVGEDVEIVTRLSTEPCQVDVDPGQLEQIVMNMVVNARDAMQGCGKLTLETYLTICDETFAATHREVKPGPYVMLTISDTGHGMDKQTQSRIFEPFFTTKEIGKGTGLGLSIVFGIVHQYGGHVWVYSEPGKGTTFKVYLPVSRDRIAGPQRPESVPTSRSGSETILLVEDEDQVRAIVEQVLHRRGYRVLCARDAREAILVAEEHSGEIDLLLTDVIMPHASGRELADQLLAKHPSMRVIYMSGYTDTVVLDHGVGSSVAFLQKPVTPQTLNRKVRAVLDSPRNA